MNRTQGILVGVLVVGLLVLGLGAALYTGAGPAPGGGSSGDDIEDFPTGTTTDGGANDSTAASPPFSFAIDSVEECGQTCRDVTATLTNNQNESATGVTVYTRVFAGQNNTATDDLVWEGKEDVGGLDAAASHTTTRRVELSLQDAQKIDQNDGWITFQTTVQTDELTITFRSSEQVA